MNLDKYFCKVCGLYTETDSWGEDGLTPTYEICSCCGVEFGNEDYTLDSIKEYRNKWIKNGANWFIKKDQPIDWDIEKQMKQIPPILL